MGELLRRRAMMAAASGGSSSPLYAFNDIDSSFYPASIPSLASSQHMTVSNRNHFVYNGYRRAAAGTAFVNLSSVQCDVPSGWPAIFSLRAGDELTIKLLNVTVKNARTDTNTGYVTITMRTASNTFIAGFSSTTSESPLYVGAKETKTYDELSTSTIIAEDIDFCMIRFYQYGSAQASNIDLTCDIEIYVNGIRYV